MSAPQSSTTRTPKENEFGMQTLPTFSPFRLGKVDTVAVKTRDGTREFNMFDVTVEPVNYVGKTAIFRMNKTTFDRLKAVAYLIGRDKPIDATWSTEQKTVLFSGRVTP